MIKYKLQSEQYYNSSNEKNTSKFHKKIKYSPTSIMTMAGRTAIRGRNTTAMSFLMNLQIYVSGNTKKYSCRSLCQPSKVRSYSIRSLVHMADPVACR